MKNTIKFIVAVLIAPLFAATASADLINWQSSVDLYAGGNNSGFVSQNGSFLVGFNGGSAATTETIGDSTFSAITFGGINSGISGGGVTVTGNFTNHAGPTTFGDGQFNGLQDVYALLNSAVYAGTSLTMSGLTIGNEYEMQIMINDARGGTNAGIRDTEWEMGFSDGVDNIVGTDMIAAEADLTNRPFNDSSSPDLAGDYIIGTFTADATTQSFSFVATRSGLNVGDVLTNVNGGQAQFNAFQLRDITPVPEPASLLVFSISGLVLLKRRRR